MTEDTIRAAGGLKDKSIQELNDDLIQFVSAVYGDDADIYFRLIDDKKRKDHYPKKLQCKMEAFPAMIQELRGFNKDGYAVHLIVNGGGQTDKEVLKAKTIHCQFMECDDMPLEDQYKLVNAFPLEPSFLVQTAKSLHTYWKIKDGDIKRFRPIQEKLIKYFGSDASIKNESQPMRLPTFYHNKNEPVMVQLVSFHPERVYTQDQLEELLPEVDEVKAKGNDERFVMPDLIQEGSRVNTLFRYCCQLWHNGYEEADCRRLVSDANTKRCQPDPLTKEELETNVFPVFKRYERGHKLNRFHKFNKEGNATGIHDIRIRDDIMSSEHLFIMNGKPYVYDNGVYLFDDKGAITKKLIENRILPQLCTINLIDRVYKLIVANASLQKDLTEINRYPDEMVNFKNGMLNVRTMELTEHRPEYLAINQIPHDYVPPEKVKGHTPTKFIRGLIPDDEDREMFYQYCGTMFTKGTSLQKFMTLEGQGDLGKSTVLRLIELALGSKNYSSLKLQQLNERFFPTQLFGMLANVCADIPSTMMDQVDQIKMITGEDDIVGEYKGVDAFKFRSYAKLFFSANKMPRTFEDESGAYYRRLLLIRIEGRGKYIPNLEQRLADEVDDFIANCMEALHKMQLNGFTESERSKEAVRELRKVSDTVESFLDDVTIRGADKKEDRAKLHKYYAEYCTATGREYKRNNNFYESLRAKGIKVNDKPSGGVRWARGVEVDTARLKEYVSPGIVDSICYS